MSSDIRIVIADDHPPTRAGVRVALEDGGFELSIEEVEKAATSGAEEALARFSEEVTASANEVAELFATVQR